jgi:hypothetical protein
MGGLLLAVASAPSEARADHCAPDVLEVEAERSRPSRGLRLSAELSALRIDQDAWRGVATGLQLGLDGAGQGWRAEVWLPTWRLAPDANASPGPTGAESVTGLGDAGGRVFRDWRVSAAWVLGAGLVVTAPTGDAAESLGMGHWMVSPGIRASHARGRLAMMASATWSEAVGSLGHAHHASPGSAGAGRTPLVSPMNARELGGALALAFAATPAFSVQLDLRGATPMGGVAGLLRATAGVHASLALTSGLTLRAGLEGALAGAPFTLRGSAGLAARLASW